MFSSILGFDPSDVLLPEAQRQADDDFILEYEQRQQSRKATWYSDPDSEEE
jgi:hypothetical protein